MRLRLGLAAVGAVLALGACFAPGPADQPGPGGPTLPTPQASLSLQIQGTVALIREALRDAGLQLNPPIQPYRPSEPASLTTVPRAVLQESIPDLDQGFVVVYELTDAATATDRGKELAAYLGSGFGQTNFPLDAQFAIGQVGGTLVFTWWSAERASNRAVAEAGFNAVSSVGQPIPVIK
ncbi:MAG: hypothetical protein QOH61_588 [Chloroflexota bacterium]|jgi:hypothetical protein|nr:hypothetical protein [Chloroflexota bacterium]